MHTNTSTNSSSSAPEYFYHCFDSRAGLFISIAFTVFKITLLLPLFLLVFYLGHRQWRTQRSFAATSHSDIFTYNMAALELISTLGAVVLLCGMYSGVTEATAVGMYVSSVGMPGQMSFHTLTCVERYLAVSHPIAYMGLKQSGGVRIRNISISCAWLLSFAWISVVALYSPDLPVVPFFCLMVFSLIVISVCSLQVFCTLIRPGPGEVGGDREQVDQTKQRALNTIMAIMGVLWLWFAGFLVCLALDTSPLLSYSDRCVVLISGNWFSLPSTMILPVLFLHRAKTTTS